MTLLEFNDLSVRYSTDDGAVHAVEDVNFTVEPGETFGLVGESGCGKTTLGKSILQLLDRNGYVESGEIWLDWVLPKWTDEGGEPTNEAIADDSIPVRQDGKMNLAALDETEIRQVRWNTISLIPQSAMNALNPVYKVGDQITEAIQLHEPETTDEEARERAMQLLESVGVEPERADDYAHEFSGGMRQRAIIAMAMACDPDLVIADEPTTALDVIIQDRVLDAIRDMQEEFDAAMLIISHDISVMAETCDRIGVMYGGRLMESGTTHDIFENAANPYTLGLENSFPTITAENEQLLSIPGTPPQLVDPPDECRFIDRCPFAVDACEKSHPPMFDVESQQGELSQATTDGHRSACHRVDEIEELRNRATEDETWQER
ncbi:oligopeptide/dipeptide ABC transporter, ATPase subunit [Halorhabdus utahensis DSM 12940]|uniref:Oligopeptide/dipeptide ABC transporter, ATPase subunit n=1 Tax=Halorhabdus utahensis (strain DSM 12940 / JCM 11049 / AX-2) TaxID=519442 RepID=C7NSD0_HALUD|nr:ABC transporter ATP-binding protein [Halorhabdus utahensis]ACV12017.1 oligopeptide/dipeptide ABC transporter, ATPase subunit [Halorhabdus utahensis DSM 12940]